MTTPAKARNASLRTPVVVLTTLTPLREGDTIVFTADGGVRRALPSERPAGLAIDVLCVHCGMALGDHADREKCLFAATTYYAGNQAVVLLAPP